MNHKKNPSHSQKKLVELFSESDKKVIEQLKNKLQTKISAQADLQKKAALILSFWINSKK